MKTSANVKSRSEKMQQTTGTKHPGHLTREGRYLIRRKLRHDKALDLSAKVMTQ